MSSIAVQEFVTPMRRAFTVPQGLPAAEFLTDLADSLSGFTARQLSGAANWFRDTREVRTFPTIAECRAACERFSAEPVGPGAFAPPPTAAERKAEAAEEHRRRREGARLCRCAMGRQADREGWLVALIEFAARAGRLPDRAEVEAVKDVARKSEGGVYAARGTPIFASLVKWRKVMLDRASIEVFGDANALRAHDAKADRPTTPSPSDGVVTADAA